jgi:hypothetical protein
MSRTFLIVLATVAAMALLLMLGHAVTAGSRFVAAPLPQPDTASPNWRVLSQDVALLLHGDAELGVRGQLYVRLEGQWRAVVLEDDGPGVMPAR